MSSRALLSVLFVALAIFWAIAVRQHLLLEEQVRRQEAIVTQLTDELSSLRNDSRAQQELIGRLDGEVASLLEQLAEVNSGEGAAEFSGRLTRHLLAPGIYVLSPANTNGERAVEDSYTIYHIVATVAVDDFEQDVQFGAASSSLISWQFYFDYDDDGRVDTDMMREFVDSLPFGGYLSSSFDPDESQRIYDKFMRSSSEAEYTPLDRIPEEGGALGRQLWSFVVSSSEEMAAWIKSTLDPESRLGRERTNPDTTP
jgi:hypothetical protein